MQEAYWSACGCWAPAASADERADHVHDDEGQCHKLCTLDERRARIDGEEPPESGLLLRNLN